MSSTCPKCGGEMVVFQKRLNASIGPFSLKRFLPAELQRYDSVELRICKSCGYMEIYWRG